jgi:hypothetical protein
MDVIQSYFFNFASGVATGVTTAVLVFVFRKLLGQVLSAITGLFSRSVRGTWSVQFSKGKEPFEESAKVFQLAHWVWGTITYPRKGRNYAFQGTLSSNILVATYEMTGDRSTVDRGAFTLALNQVGSPTEMVGTYSWTDDETQVPRSDYYKWIKLN